ncbi:hypothetical protein BN1326_100005 [Staphylococcus argenteus]|uniref:Uncharacterized protein n=1 Tax=Staphylococcus argenteus TaxID=985002 RepID=A0A7U7JQ28_9STAP|nr:hypothetical protein BN1326_100005 [Staphylococcus argenteus]CRI09843.1 hypothetical protein BN1326_100005 [Staphylococcus argenteus]
MNYCVSFYIDIIIHTPSKVWHSNKYDVGFILITTNKLEFYN